jgi:acyl-coenzyme A synthetase/AMP-(fatty) acid ligase
VALDVINIVTITEFYPVFVAGQVSPYKRLSGGVWFVDSIPKTTTGKINRRELRKSIDMLL